MGSILFKGDKKMAKALIEYLSLDQQYAKSARQLCLDAIAEIFGFNYSSSWAYDLDYLSTDKDQYSAKRGGAFFVAIRDKIVVGAAGIRAFATLTALPEMIVKRYQRPQLVSTLMRAYVRKDHRRMGIGSELTSLCEQAACRLGYRYIYMHTHRSFGLDPVDFWQRCGYTVILREVDDSCTVHLEKGI